MVSGVRDGFRVGLHADYTWREGQHGMGRRACSGDYLAAQCAEARAVGPLTWWQMEAHTRLTVCMVTRWGQCGQWIKKRIVVVGLHLSG